MTILVQFTLNHTAENTDKIIRFFAEILPDTRTFAGNISAELFKQEQDGDALNLFEKWESAAHFEKYIEWRKSIGDFDRLGSMLTDTPMITIMDKQAS